MKEDYRELSNIGVPQRRISVSDDVYIASNELLNANMRPNVKRQPYISRDNEYKSKLDLFTGQNLKPPKREQPPLFDLFKEEYLPNRNDVMNKVNAQKCRYKDVTSDISRQYETPIEPVMVPPGLDLGYNAEPSNRPFHPYYRTDEKTSEELTGKIRPDYDISNRTNPGLMGYKPPQEQECIKRRPDAVYGIPQGQVISNIFSPFSKTIKHQDILIEHETQRGLTKNEYIGSGGGTKFKSIKHQDTLVEHETQRGLTKNEYVGTGGGITFKSSETNNTKIREKSKKKAKPEETGGLTGLLSIFKKAPKIQDYYSKTPKAVEYQNNIAERRTVEPIVYMVTRTDGELVPANSLNKRPLNGKTNIIDTYKTNDVRLDNNLPTTKKINDYIETARDTAGISSREHMGNKFSSESQYSGFRIPMSSEQIRENEMGNLDMDNRHNMDMTGEYLMPNKKQYEFIEDHSSGVITPANRKTNRTTYKPLMKEPKRENIKSYVGISGSGAISSDRYKGTDPLVKKNNARHASTIIRRINPAGTVCGQNYNTNSLPPQSTKRKLVMGSMIGQTRVGSGSRFANDPGVLLPAYKSSWRFSPQYSWYQGENSTKLVNKKPENVVTGRVMDPQFIKPLFNAKSGNFK